LLMIALVFKKGEMGSQPRAQPTEPKLGCYRENTVIGYLPFSDRPVRSS
jgi:hypothetical protein